MEQARLITPLSYKDAEQLANVMKYSTYIHRHLDWRMPEDWLGKQPFLILTDKQGPQAALACPEDPPGIAWIRFFACSYSVKLLQTWTELLRPALMDFHAARPILAAVAVQSWFDHLLSSSGFISHQRIVILEWFAGDPVAVKLNNDVSIRPIIQDDIQTVTNVDQSSFEKLWQLSQAGLQAAYDQSSYATVAVIDGEIIGYQISNLTSNSAHLSRLAVLPEHQNKHIGKMLVDDLLNFYSQRGIKHITVNTQHNNSASLALYQKLGFTLTKESFPVYVYPYGEFIL